MEEGAQERKERGGKRMEEQEEGRKDGEMGGRGRKYSGREFLTARYDGVDIFIC